MQTEFDVVLQKLSDAGDDNIVSQLKEMFLAIIKMSNDELVATYQTVGVVAPKLPGIANQQFIADIKKAIISQMKFNISKASSGNYRSIGLALSRRFSEVTGRHLDR
jgi:hypothetical protein